MGTIRKDILILVPGIEVQGGVTNYYYSIINKFSLPVKYFVRGSRKWPYRHNIFYEFTRAIKDIFSFIYILLKESIRIVNVNTSLGTRGIVRDAFFIIISKVFRKKVIVFFRGWNIKNKTKFTTFLIKLVFFKADRIIVLSSEVRNMLENWGYRSKIFVETTLVDDTLVEGIDDAYINNKYSVNSRYYKILFLSRVEKQKGIYEAIQTYKLVKKHFKNCKFIIAGDGFELNQVRSMVKNEKIKDVEFLGYVKGEQKKKAYLEAHIFIFTSYTEGMPNAVLEAMAMGLPVFTTDVGGIKDFFVNRENGLLFYKCNPIQFANGILYYLHNRNELLRISLNNYQYAQKHFISSEVVKRLELIYLEVLNSKNNSCLSMK